MSKTAVIYKSKQGLHVNMPNGLRKKRGVTCFPMNSGKRWIFPAMTRFCTEADSMREPSAALSGSKKAA